MPVRLSRLDAVLFNLAVESIQVVKEGDEHARLAYLSGKYRFIRGLSPADSDKMLSIIVMQQTRRDLGMMFYEPDYD